MNFYYGLVDEQNCAWGFLEESDPRAWEDEEKTVLKPSMIFLNQAEWQGLLAGQSTGMAIVSYEGRVFNAVEGIYYVDADGWHKKSEEQFNQEKANKKAEELVNKLYEIKAAKAYGGIIINNLLVFETNQTAITNTVASLALMSDTSTANWKFYTVDGKPFVQTVNKIQLAGLAQFAQTMINGCFAVEGQFCNQLQTFTVDQLNDEEVTSEFLSQAQAAMDNINNHIEINLGE